ncbi:dihydrolipoamide dehydrogenase [Azospirillum thiophilum]|uniref:Dihydrolipoyl dehydrogenase n=1 Tax=Azospirillum thiophilum TaxID=528244 RepID=A0AAC8ZV82_9PROT|nr:dihydrolipoyl dehydrogenase [Azospirillum thiophilum]ALG72985.1 dihydrolipoamide dehydrogenase [Azospirillum thiophilum]KJR64099.1 dihydrolipoamide dehydrogenase [Azospirillum thiophilum]
MSTPSIKTVTAKVLVVGGGPGGYVAAIRAGQLGLDTVLVEADRLGGTCLIRGCIPSKALIHVAARFEAMERSVGGGHAGIALDTRPRLDLAAATRWKDGIVDRLSGGVAALLRKAKVRVLHGWAVFSDAKTCIVQGRDGPLTVKAEHVILATGSEPVPLPALPFGGPVLSSTEALSLDRLPRRLVVVGGGYIGLELGSAFARMGSAVTVVEAQPRILPLYDEALTDPVRRWLERSGVTVHLGARALGLEAEGEGHALAVRAADGGTIRLPADAVLSTVGRRPRLEGWGFETMGVDRKGAFVAVDDQCRTSMRDVWAIGDLVGEPMLAHKASAQGEMVAEIIAGHRRRFAPVAIPAVCFTEPEIVSVGLSPDEASAQGIDAIVDRFPFAANGRALTLDSGESGFVRLVARREDRRVIGIQAVGAHVSELSGEFALALEMGAELEDVAGTIHAHPTLGETFHEAALRLLGRSLHF